MLNYTVSVWCHLDLATGYMCKKKIKCTVVTKQLFTCVPPFYAENDAGKTASPNRAQPRHPKASPGQMTLRGREKGD